MLTAILVSKVIGIRSVVQQLEGSLELKSWSTTRHCFSQVGRPQSQILGLTCSMQGILIDVDSAFCYRLPSVC